MSPEQIQGGEVDARSDQYAFSSTLYHALHGHPPVSGQTAAGLMRAIVAGEILEPRGGRQVPERIRRVVRRGLNRNPADRYPSMVELAAALRQNLVRRRRWPLVAIALVLLAAVTTATWRIWGPTSPRAAPKASVKAAAEGGPGGVLPGFLREKQILDGVLALHAQGRFAECVARGDQEKVRSELLTYFIATCAYSANDLDRLTRACRELDTRFPDGAYRHYCKQLMDGWHEMTKLDASMHLAKLYREERWQECLAYGKQERYRSEMFLHYLSSCAVEAGDHATLSRVCDELSAEYPSHAYTKMCRGELETLGE
jgi:hypothetical protein